MADGKTQRPFLPPPRPKPSAEQNARNTEVASEVGEFGRPLTGAAPADPAPVEPPPPPQPKVPSPTKSKSSEPTVEGDKPWPVKFEVSLEVYQELRMEASRRRITIKYLCLEMLKEKGFSVDLEKASQDGRRNR